MAGCAAVRCCCRGSFARAMQLLRYLCENSIGLEQWLEVLDDAGQSYELLENAGEAGIVPDFTGKNLEFFVPYAGFELQILLQITQLTHGRGEFIL